LSNSKEKNFSARKNAKINSFEKGGNTLFLSTPTSFTNLMEASSTRSKSKLILALDLDFRNDITNLAKDAKEIVSLTAEYFCAIKINFHLIAPLGLSELKSLNELIASRYQLPTIADIKLNDIGNSNRVATEYLWNAGFDAVIVNPFVGYEGGLDVVLNRAGVLGKGVIFLAYMSHKAADEGYGLILRDNNKTIFDLFLERANYWNANAVIVGSTRPDRIKLAREKLRNEIKIISPGSGAQGGDPKKSLEAGADYLIVGRSIIDAENPREEARRLFQSLPV
jgi:orotidine-5'-phosphate decarboxylase